MKTDFIGRVLAQAGKVVESRSSVLVPLQWNIVILALFLFLFILAKAPAWLDIGVFVLLAIAVMQSAFAHDYFMKKDAVALRSEQHAISKYAIDKGLYGDSDSGMREVPKLGSEFLLPVDTGKRQISRATRSSGRKSE